MSSNFLDQFYTIDPDSGEYIIDIALQDYDDIFNSWDSSVYNIRDIDPSLKSFLDECSHDIQMRKKVIIRFNIFNQKKNSMKEKNIISGIQNFYNYSLHISNRNIKVRRKKVLLYVLTSFFFMSLSFLVPHTILSHLIHDIVLMSLTVGGWVFLWEAFSLQFIHNSEVVKRRKQYQRLSKAPITFKYVT